MNLTFLELLGLTLFIPVILALGIFFIIIYLTREYWGKKECEKYKKVKETTENTYESELINQSDKTKYYDIIENNLKELPEIKIQQNLGLLINSFEEIQNNIIDTIKPFSLWSEKIRGFCSRFKEIVPVVHQLTANKTLLVRRHFNQDLNKSILNIANFAKDEAEQKLDEEFTFLDDRIKYYEGLFNNWHDLLEIASDGICDDEKIIENKWGWLAHGIRTNFYDKDLKKSFVWLPWDVVSSSALLQQLFNWMKEEINQLGWRFDTICAMESSGLSMATLMSAYWQKELIAIDNHNYRFLPIGKPSSLDKILLVDSALQTGGHLERSIKNIQDARAKVAGVICITINDMLPPTKKEYSIIEEMVERKQLVYLFKISDLYKTWKKSLIKK